MDAVIQQLLQWTQFSGLAALCASFESGKYEAHTDTIQSLPALGQTQGCMVWLLAAPAFWEWYWLPGSLENLRRIAMIQ